MRAIGHWVLGAGCGKDAEGIGQRAEGFEFGSRTRLRPIRRNYAAAKDAQVGNIEHRAWRADKAYSSKLKAEGRGQSA